MSVIEILRQLRRLDCFRLIRRSPTERQPLRFGKRIEEAAFLVQQSWFDYRVESGVPANCSQETLGCQFTKAPLGFSFHAQTCRV
jgi:hypothetical protein